MLNRQGLNARQVYNILTAVSQSLSVTIKIANEDCKLAVDTLQESVKVSQSRSNCFTFQVPLFPTLINQAKYSV